MFVVVVDVELAMEFEAVLLLYCPLNLALVQGFDEWAPSGNGVFTDLI